MHVAAYFAARSDFSLLSDIFLKVSTRSSLDLLHWGGGGGGGGCSILQVRDNGCHCDIGNAAGPRPQFI